MRVLCVAEKPSIAKSISQILSGGQFTTHNTQTNYIKNYEFDYPQTQSFFTVTCVSGHLTNVDFYDTHRKWTSCDPFSLFDAPVEVQTASDKKGIERNLQTEARRSDVLMIWTDCDREGEHIGMEVAQVCRKVKPNIRIKRARFSAIIAQQIHNAAQHPVELDKRQADAVEARIMLDLKVGAAFTRLQTLTLQGRIQQIANEKNIVSYGPCQFPTLGFVVQRYSYVKMFKPETFWYIYLSLSRPTPSQGSEETKFNWKRNHLFDQIATMNIYSFMMENPIARVTKVTNKTTKKWKPLPLTTVELQKAGSRLLKLAPKKILDIAEKLYQQGFVSYPRTETDQFDPQFDFMSLIGKQAVDPNWGQFATSLQGGGFGVPRRGKNDDKAHPPIHPTAHAGNLAGDDKRVYEYITRRFLACCSKDAEGWQTTVEVVCGGEDFTATGLIVKEKNYLNVYIYEKWNGHHVPDFQEGEEFEPSLCEIRQGETSRPNYLTEADLVTLMDKNGIGTDATIAQHIQTIIDRDYVIERFEGATKYLIPSTLGIGLIEGYNQIGLTKSVSKPQLRRETERRMVQVCEGTTTKHEIVSRSLDQYKEMFIIVRREFDKVTASVNRYLSGEGNANADGNQIGGGPGAGGGGGGGGGGGAGGGGGRGRGGNGGDGDNDWDAGNGDDAGGSTRGGRGRGRGTAARGRGATRGRGVGTAKRGRGKAAGPSTIITLSDAEDEHAVDQSSSSNASVPSTMVNSTGATSDTSSGSAAFNAFASSSRQVGSSYSSSTYPTPAPKSVVRPPAPPTVGTASGETKCNCPQPQAAVKRQVSKETASKGKWFWACPDFNGCGFFQWADDPGPAAASGSRTPSSVPAKRSYPSAQAGVDTAIRQCKCNEDAVLLTVMKESENKGRKFWKCRKADHSGCNFYEWDDEPPRAGGGTISRTMSLNQSGSGGGQSGTCFKCNQEGHWANSCPNDGGQSSKRTRSFGTSANDRSTLTCFKCQQPGHVSTSCPNDSKSGYKSHPSANGGSSTSCFKCGQTGHWSNACPQEGGGGGSGRSYSSGSGSRGSKRGRGGSSSRGKRGSGRGGKKKSAFAAADDY